MTDTGRGARSRGGVVTFLFTDLVASTQLAARLGEDSAEELRRVHFSLLRKAIADCAGEEVKNLGDGVMAVFTSPLDAVEAAVTIQRNVAEHNCAHPDRALGVRIGLHSGEPAREDGDYFGTVVVVASRLCAAAAGGQILAHELVGTLLGSRGGFPLSAVGRLELKGLSESVPAVEVLWAPEARPSTATRAPVPARRPRRRVPRGPDLVGRATELTQLQEAFDSARDEGFRCVLVSADAGVGKTRLAAELLTLHADDAVMLQSRAHPMGSGVAFGAWVEALDPLVQSMGDDEVAETCGGFLDDLAGLFHRVAALRGPWSTAPAGHEPPRPRLMAGLARMVDELCAQRPLVVLLDDVHWADASSWEVLRHLARRLIDAPLLVVLTARPTELAEHDVAAGALFELEQDGLLTRLDLTPLQDAGLRALAEQIIGATPAPALVEWLSDRSRGNPLFALGLLRALVEENADLGAPVLRRLPESLAERVAARARTMPAPQMAVFELLAVAGRPVLLTELALLAEQSVEQLTPTLDDAVASRGAVESERGPDLTYEISHPLVRDAVYEQIGAARRRMLHRHAARVFRGLGRIGEAAGHYARGADRGDAEAVVALIDALREAEERETAPEALTVLGVLVDLLGPDDPRWLQVLDVLREDAEWVTDHRGDVNPPVAVAALRAMDRRLAPDDPPARRALVKFRLAHFLAWGTGDADEAEVLCRQARELYEAAGRTHQALIAGRELAWILGCRGEFGQMIVEAESVARQAAEAGDTAAEMLAWAAMLAVHVTAGRFEVGERISERVASLAGPTATPFRRTILANMAAMTLIGKGRVREALATVAEVKRTDPGYRDTSHVELESMFRWYIGDYPGAVEVAQESAAWCPSPRLRRLPGMAFGLLSSVEVGDHATAQAFLDRAESILRGREWQFNGPMVRYGCGLLAWAQGREPDAVVAMRGAGARLERMGSDLWAMTPLHLDLVEIGAGIGDASALAQGAAVLERYAALRPELHFAAMAAAGRSWGALAAGDRDRAVAQAREAVEQSDRTEFNALRGRARHVFGVALGPSTEAATVLQEAAACFAECGAVWRRERVLDVLRRHGSSGRRALAGSLGPESLTAREREVCRLAAQGLTAREIGAALFLGVRTVETHLRNAYAKLGVESKLDLVRRAAEFGLS